MDGLQGKVVIVTGGTRGIGRQIVRGALARGAQVAFCGRSIAEDAVGLPAGQDQALAVRADVSCEGDVDAMFDAAIGAYGRVDVVINNAGISRGHLMVSLPAEVWDEVMAVNLTGAFLVSRRAVRQFLAQGDGGRIVSIGSVTQNGAPSNASYATSKGGLVGLTRAIAREYEDRGIHANLVIGGYVDTDMMRHAPEALRQRIVELCPQGRMASAEEIASVVFFLASGRSLHVNGQAVYASGGLVDLPPYG